MTLYELLMLFNDHDSAD